MAPQHTVITVPSISLAPAPGLGGGGAGDVGGAPEGEGEGAPTACVRPRHCHALASLGSSDKLILQKVFFANYCNYPVFKLPLTVYRQTSLFGGHIDQLLNGELFSRTWYGEMERYRFSKNP